MQESYLLCDSEGHCILKTLQAPLQKAKITHSSAAHTSMILKGLKGKNYSELGDTFILTLLWKQLVVAPQQVLY